MEKKSFFIQEKIDGFLLIKKGISIRDIMSFQLSKSPNLQSGLVRFLVERLYCFGNSISASRVTNAHAMMKRRDYLKRLKKCMAGGKIQVPHPIFMNKLADLSNFEKVWRAKMVSNFTVGAGNYKALELLPQNIKFLVKLFNVLVEGRSIFALKFEGACSKCIVMRFTFPHEIESGEMLVTFQMLEDGGFSSAIHSLVLSIAKTRNAGIELKIRDDEHPLIQFFYSNRLQIGIHPFNYDKFSVKTVTFYNKPEDMENLLCSEIFQNLMKNLDFNNDAGYKRNQGFLEKYIPAKFKKIRLAHLA
jgi:hypothetical protein